MVRHQRWFSWVNGCLNGERELHPIYQATKEFEKVAGYLLHARPATSYSPNCASPNITLHDPFYTGLQSWPTPTRLGSSKEEMVNRGTLLCGGGLALAKLNQSRFAIAKLLHNRRECFRAPKRLANFISGSAGRRETTTRNSVTPKRRRL